jgi:excisionase family DNA binding protein
MSDTAKEWLTRTEAAVICGLHPETLRRALARGDLRASKPPGSRLWRIHRADLDTYLRGGAA